MTDRNTRRTGRRAPDPHEHALAQALGHALGDSGEAGARVLDELRVFDRLSAPRLIQAAPGAPVDLILAFPLPARRPDGAVGGSVVALGRIAAGSRAGALATVNLADVDVGARRLESILRLQVGARAASAHAARATGSFREKRYEPDSPVEIGDLSPNGPSAHALCRAVHGARKAWLLPHLESCVRSAVERTARPDFALRSPLPGRLVIFTDETDGTVSVSVKGRDKSYSTLARKLAPDTPGLTPDRDGSQVMPGQVILRIPKAQVCLENIVALLMRAVEAQETEKDRSQISMGFGSLRSRLDRDALRSLASAGDESVDLYEWLSTSPTAQVRLNRRQALDTHPILVARAVKRCAGGPAIHGKPERGKPDESTLASDLSRSIDEEQPITDVLADLYRTSRSAVRSLAGISARALDGNGEAVIRTLPLLREAPTAHVPISRPGVPLPEQWLALSRMAGLCIELGSGSFLTGPTLPGGAASILSREAPFWKEEGGLTRAESFRGQAFVIRDAMEGFSRHVLLPVAYDILSRRARAKGASSGSISAWDLPMLVTGDGRSALGEAVVRGRRLAKLLELSDRWHRSAQRIDAEIVRETDTRTWLPLSSPYRDPNGSGLVVPPLSSAQELAEEGLRMGHCVPQYVRACLEEGCHIVSVRNSSGESISTAELRFGSSSPEDAVPRLVVVQHEGKQTGDVKSEAPREARAVLEGYLAAVLNREVTVDRQALGEALQARLARRDTVPGLLDVGYDPSDSAARDLALRQYAFMLPMDERGLGHGEWIRKLGLAAVMERALDDDISRRASPGTLVGSPLNRLARSGAAR